MQGLGFSIGLKGDRGVREGCVGFRRVSLRRMWRLSESYVWVFRVQSSSDLLIVGFGV